MATQNPVPVPDRRGRGATPDDDDVAAAVARRTLSRRGVDYADEVRRLLDAALAEVERRGTASTPRVADVVAAAGLSNDAFYRHFPSKDALVAALVDDGAARLRSYLAHQMGKARTPEAAVRRWVEGVLAQARGEVARTTRAVLANGGAVTPGRHPASGRLATLLEEPLAALGAADPARGAAFAAHAVLGVLADHLWAGTEPTRADVGAVTRLVLRVAG